MDKDRVPIYQYTTDRGVEIRVDAIYEEGQITYYSSEVFTPICMDNLCNPIAIELQWDLLGRFLNYVELGDKPLTKFDHQPFELKDYDLLKKILKDKESLLQDYQMEDLVDTTKLVYSEEIDGMTGATSKTFADEIVPGAIYTCYTLWHLVNGVIDEVLVHYTDSLLDVSLKRYMLSSSVEAYQGYVLSAIEDFDYDMLNREILDLVYSSNPYIAVQALKVIGRQSWDGESMSKLIGDIEEFSNPVQNALLGIMEDRVLPSSILRRMIEFLPKANAFQIKIIYSVLKFNTASIDGELKKILLQKMRSNNRVWKGIDYQLAEALDLL